MIKSLLLHPLGPCLILALGGLVLLPLRHRGRVSATSPGRWALPAAFAFLLAAGIVMLSLRTGQEPRHVVQWNWQPLISASSTLSWRLDGWNWLAGLLVLCATAAALAVQEDPANDYLGPTRVRQTVWLGAAAMAFVFADNLVTLACCWMALDLALVLRLLPSVTEQPAARIVNQISLGGLAVLAALILAGPGNARLSFASGAGLSGVALALLWLAGLILAGAYPFHLWLTATGELELGDQVALQLIGPTAGIWLLARVQGVAGPAWLQRPEWAALGALALLGTALAAWAASNQAAAWRWIAINRASLMVLTASVAATAGPAALIWPLVTFTLGAGLLGLGLAVRERWGWNLPTWLGALTIWGLPGTTGFLARSALGWSSVTVRGGIGGNPAVLPLGPLLSILILVAEALLAAALWELATNRLRLVTEQESVPKSILAHPAAMRLGAATVVLAIPLVLWGVSPRQTLSLAGLAHSGLPGTLFQAIAATRGSVWVGLIVAGIAGVALGWLRPRIFGGMRGWQEGIPALVSLEWLYRALIMALQFAGAGLQYFARLGEGEGYIGWVCLGAFILWVLLRT